MRSTPRNTEVLRYNYDRVDDDDDVPESCDDVRYFDDGDDGIHTYILYIHSLILYIHTYLHTFIHTYIHSYIHSSIHMKSFLRVTRRTW